MILFVVDLRDEEFSESFVFDALQERVACSGRVKVLPGDSFVGGCFASGGWPKERGKGSSTVELGRLFRRKGLFC